MTDTPRTKQLKDLRQKRLAFFEKKAETSSGEPISKNGIKSNRMERPLHQSVISKKLENSDAAEKLNCAKPKPFQNAGNMESSSCPGESLLDFGSKSSHDIRCSNDSSINKSENGLQRIGLVEKSTKKTPRDETLTASGRKTAKNPQAYEIKVLDEASSERSLRENGVAKVEGIKTFSSSVAPNGQALGGKPVRKTDPRLQSDKDKRRSSDFGQDETVSRLNAEKPEASTHLKEGSTSLKKLAKQGSETFRIMGNEPSEKSGVPRASESYVSLNSHWPTVRPSLPQPQCFDPSQVKSKDDTLLTDRKKILTANFKDDKRQQTDYTKCRDVSRKATGCSFPVQSGTPFNSATLAGDHHEKIFKPSTFPVDNKDLKTGNSFGTNSSSGILSDNGKLGKAVTRSRRLPNSSMKSSVSIQMDQIEDFRDRELDAGPRQSDTCASSLSSSITKSNAGDEHAGDSVMVSEENDNIKSQQHLPKAVHLSGVDYRKEPELLPTPSESVEFLVPDFLKDIPEVNAVKRSQIPFADSNDFLSSSDAEPKSEVISSETLVSTTSSTLVEPKSEVLSSETLVSTIASTLNFGSVNLELVLGKERMERLLKNILEIDGSSTLSLQNSTITDLSVTNSSCDLQGKLKDQSHDLKDSSVLERKDSPDKGKLYNAFNNPQTSCESLGLRTHRPSAADDESRSRTSLQSLSSSSVEAKKEKTKCSFLVDEIYAEAQLLKDEQGCGSRSDFAMATEPDTQTEVRSKPKPQPGYGEIAQSACDFRGANAKSLNEEVNEVKNCSLKPSGTCGSHSRESVQVESNGHHEKKKRSHMRETSKLEIDSKEEHIRGILRKMQQQRSQEHQRPKDTAENDSTQHSCYVNPVIDRYFKSMENLSFEKESLLPKALPEKSLGDGLEFGVVGRSLNQMEEDTTTAASEDGFQKKLKDVKRDLLQAIDQNNDTLFTKVASAVDVGEKDEEIGRDVSGTSNLLGSSLANERQQVKADKRKENDGRVKSLSPPSESQVRNTSAKISDQEPLVRTSTKAKGEEKHNHRVKTSEKMQSSNGVGSSCTTTSVWKLDQPPNDEQVSGTLEVSSSSVRSGMKQVVKQPVFAPVVDVRDSEEFEYSDLGGRGRSSFGEFFKDEMSINLRDSGDGSAVGRSRNSSVFPQSQLKSIVEDYAMDSVNFDYSVENKVSLPEELKATLCLNLGDSFDAGPEQRGEGNKGNSDLIQMKDGKRQEKKSSKSLPLRKSLTKSPELQRVDPGRDSPQKLKQKETVLAAKSTQTQDSDTEDAGGPAAGNDDYYQDFVHHLVNDSRFRNSPPKSTGSSSPPHVPKLQLSDDTALPSKSVSRPRAKSAKVSSSKSRPGSSLSSVLAKARVAWKDEDLFADVCASVPAVPASRPRPWSAKVVFRGSLLDDFDHSAVAHDLSRRQRPSSVGPRSRRTLTSSSVDLGHSDEDVGSRHVKEQRRSHTPSTVAQSVQINKAKGQSKRLYRFTTEDYEKYSALSPRIQVGELSMLTSFPDEILLKIFSYLRPSDLSRCGRVCQHFFRVAMDSSLWRRIELEEQAMTDKHLAAIGRKRPSSLVLLQCTGDQVTANGLRQLFWECSESLRELSFSSCSKGHLTGENILLHATNRCRNVSQLDGSWTNLSSQGIIAFSEESERLVSVCLNGCQSINDEAVQTLVARHGRHLVTLELLGLFGLTNAAVEAIGDCCKNLVTLTLGQCWKLTDSCLARLSISMPRLENLDLRGCKQIKDQTIHQLVKNCGQLTSLSLANCPNLTDSSLAEISVQCPRLRSLDVCGCNKLTNVGVKTLVSGCNLLEYLDISSTSINHRSVTAIASYCSRRLEVLKLNFCKQVNMECLMRLVKNCKRLKKLYVYGVKGLHNVEELKTLNAKIWIEM